MQRTYYLLLTWARGGSKENEGKDPLKPEATTYTGRNEEHMRPKILGKSVESVKGTISELT